jgi:hypothetical protein
MHSMSHYGRNHISLEFSWQGTETKFNYINLKEDLLRGPQQ